MKFSYLEKFGLRIVPKYLGNSPAGFDVIRIKTDEVVSTCGTLCEAENFIDSQGSVFGKSILVGSAAEVKGY